jgi:hypothetical protein
MGLPGPTRPRVSRETRLLLATILISIAVLWALARIRFPDRPATTNPVPPLLTQLAAPPAFDDLASEVAKLESRLLPSLVDVGPSSALRVRDAVGAMFLPAAEGTPPPVPEMRVLARDAASGLALVAIPGAPAPELVPWETPRLERPRYLIATTASAQGPSLRPVFIGRLHPVASPAWPGGIWTMPVRTTVTPGEFLFTTDGALAGLVVASGESPALVPGGALLRAADELLATKTRAGGGWLGVEVQTLPHPLSSAIRRQAATEAGGPAAPGVMIAWVDPNGPAAEKLLAMDVIETAGGKPVRSPDEWRILLARLLPSESIVLRVRRGEETREVPLTVAARPKPGGPVALGLRMRTIRGIGAEILEVADGSAAAHAGLREGDVITAIGDIHTPAASQVTEAFADAPGDRPLLAAITRGKRHVVLAIEKFSSEDVKQ